MNMMSGRAHLHFFGACAHACMTDHVGVVRHVSRAAWGGVAAVCALVCSQVLYLNS